MIGQTISHYKILDKLGEGGMGIVYKAHDLKLDRIVALKFLPHHLTANEAEQARFLQEARAASSLNHPGICAIHTIGEEGDQQFIDMEFLDGVTLRQKLETGDLKLETAIPYAIQIGEALQEAHSKGIVHRDIKTENIMVNSKNQIKVMDFGLAKLKGSLKLTKTSSTPIEFAQSSNLYRFHNLQAISFQNSHPAEDGAESMYAFVGDQHSNEQLSIEISLGSWK